MMRACCVFAVFSSRAQKPQILGLRAAQRNLLVGILQKGLVHLLIPGFFVLMFDLFGGSLALHKMSLMLGGLLKHKIV